MSSKFSLLASAMPTFTKKDTVEAKVDALADYQVQLLDYLRYSLSNLDEDNFNATGLKQIMAPVLLEVKDLSGKYTALSVTADGLKTTVEGYEDTVEGYAKEVSEFSQTVSGFSAKVESYEKDVEWYAGQVSSFEQTVGGFRTTVSNYESAVDDYAAEVNGYASEVAGYKSQVSTFEQTVTGFNTKVESYEKDVEGYASQVSSFNQTVAGFNTKVEKYEKDLQGYSSQVSSFEQTATKIAATVSAVDDANGNVTAASIVAAINATSGSSMVKIEADHILMTGTTTFAKSSDIPTYTSQLTNNSGFVNESGVTTIVGGLVTADYVNALGVYASTLVSEGRYSYQTVSIANGCIDFYSGSIYDSDYGYLIVSASNLWLEASSELRINVGSGYWEISGSGIFHYNKYGERDNEVVLKY
jgi:uncharacterized protein YoxC